MQVYVVYKMHCTKLLKVHKLLINFSVNSDSTKIGEHQEVLFYEVSVGTDRRYANTRDNIQPFANVGLNKTWTFLNLQLSVDNSVYYITVRAHGASTSKVEVTSNGIKVINESRLVANGEIEIPR